MKTHDVPVLADSDSLSGHAAESRLAALERVIAYARDEAEKLKADVLVFCLDASLAVARDELDGQRTGAKTLRPNSRKKLRH